MAYYTIYYNPMNGEDSSPFGVYESFDDAMQHKGVWDMVHEIPNVEARQMLLKDMYDDVEIECSEQNYVDDDDCYELRSRLFDRNVQMHIENKWSGWQLLLDYDEDKDNPYNNPN